MRIHKPKLAPIKWITPTPSELKVNFDGATFTKSDEVRIGVIIRNKSGEVMAVLSKKIA